MDRLALAVAFAETSNCTRGSGVTYNNCHGIMVFDKNGRRSLRRFVSKEDSFVAFKELWIRGYGGRFPTIAMAKKYTGNDRAQTWLDIVKQKY